MYIRKTEDEFEIQGNYGFGYEMVTTETNRKDAREQIETYRASEPGIPFRWVKKRVKIDEVSADLIRAVDNLRKSLKGEASNFKVTETSVSFDI
jgi:hypothetical protein